MPRRVYLLRWALGIASIALPSTARADIAPGPVEYSMLAFVWVLTTLVLGVAIYAVVRRIRGKDTGSESSAETPAPSIWKRALFRRSMAVAAVVAFVGWLVGGWWIAEQDQQRRNEMRRRMHMEPVERSASSVK